MASSDDLKMAKQKTLSARDRYLRAKYGISEAQWLAVLKAQGGTCAICEGNNGGKTLSQVVSTLRFLRRKQGIILAVIDYLQIIDPDDRRQPREQQLSTATRTLKHLAKDLNIPIIALSQLNRSVDNREDKRPHLADLRESGSIEQDADIVLFVYREEYYLNRKEPPVSDAGYADFQAELAACKGKAEIIIGKARHGPTGTVAMAFSGEMTRFSDLAREVGRG